MMSCECGCTKGKTKDNLYARWSAMHSRCKNPLNKSYHLYGGRGVKVDERWNCFAAFVSDMGVPENGMSLDRINSSGNYEKENCRWATAKQQANNRRSNAIINAFGKKMTLSEWEDETGISWSTISQRIKTLGWDPEAALSTPVGGTLGKKTRTLFVEVNGEKIALAELAKMYSIPANTLRKRIFEMRWDIDRALSSPIRPY